MWNKIWRALLGMCGIIRKDLKFTTENNAEFKKSLEAAEIVLTMSDGILQNGIQAVTDSVVNHVLAYVGLSMSKSIRYLYPEVLKNPKVTSEPQYNEIIESQGGGIQIDNINKNFGDNIQMIGFAFDIPQETKIAICYWLYKQVGKPYGFLDFLSQLEENPSDSTLHDPGYICSALVATAYEQIAGFKICAPEVKSEKASPADVYNYLLKNIKARQSRYNC